MAVAEVKLPSQPPAAAQSIMARLARSTLAAAAADAVICSFLSGIWILLGAAVAADAGSLACGEGCPAVNAALQVMVAAAFSLALVSPLALVLLVLGAGSVANPDEEKALPARKSFAAVAREMLRDPVIIGLLVSWAFSLLMLVGVLLKDYSPAKGSRQDRIGSLIMDLGALGSHTFCFFVHPIAALRLWRSWRVIQLRQRCSNAV